MSAGTIAAIVSAVAAVLQVIVFAAGYYILYRIYRRMVDDMERQRTANGRPQVIVTDDYGGLPDVSLVVRNEGDGAARNISFEFSAPVESSDGTVISELSYFRHGMSSLIPRGRVTAYWDDLNNLVPLLKERGLEEGIAITTRYEDLAGERYETEWRVNPMLYQDDRYVYDKDISDLVDAVESLRDGENIARKRYKPGPLDSPSKTMSSGQSPKEPREDGDSSGGSGVSPES